jgi:DNA end-binding protein Ku
MPTTSTRSLWSGSISFGIVTIPVRLVSAVRDRQLRFHQVSESRKARVRQRLVAEGTDHEVPRDDIVKGFEWSPGKYVTVDEQELRALAAEKSRAIEIIDFVALGEIDPLFFDTPYWVLPDERAGRAYALLVEAMRSAGRVAIARFVMRNKEVLAAIRPVAHGLCLETMHYHDEVVPLEDASPDVKPVKPNERELVVARQIIDSLTTEFHADRYEDEYRKRVLAFLQKKAEGKLETIVEEPPHREEKVLDLMAALEASLGQARKRGERAERPREAPRAERQRAAPRPHPRRHGKRAS